MKTGVRAAVQVFGKCLHVENLDLSGKGSRGLDPQPQARKNLSPNTCKAPEDLGFQVLGFRGQGLGLSCTEAYIDVKIGFILPRGVITPRDPKTTTNKGT